MGCNSSAPDLTLSNTDSENILKSSKEEINKNVREDIGISELSTKLSDTHDKGGDAIVKMVLPMCDTVIGDTAGEPLDSNNTSIKEAPSLKLQEAVPEKNENGQIESKISSNATVNDTDETKDISSDLPPESTNTDMLQTQKKLSDLPTESTDTLQTEEKLSTLPEVVEKVVEFHVSDKLDTFASEESQHETKTEEANSETPNIEAAAEAVSNTEEVQQSPSPSQSASSRVTRWEALADAAAELPPSLTVDPLTGQLYIYSK